MLVFQQGLYIQMERSIKDNICNRAREGGRTVGFGKVAAIID